MKIGKVYVVTKESDDGTFEVGDRISLQADGDIICNEVGWCVDAKYVNDAIQGMEIEVDQEWVEKRRKQLLKELEALDGTSMV